jgi:hypothetical protein
MAPEIFEGRDFDWSADICAYAMLVYVPTTRLDIFPELREFRFARMIVSGGRPPFPPGFDSRWKTLIEDCWHQDPIKRPTFQEVVRRLGSAEFFNESIDIARSVRISRASSRNRPKNFSSFFFFLWAITGVRP